jgi:membrane-bound ClpP family serine protease
MAEARTDVVDRDPELIKQDIAAARDQLALTVDTLAERVNPQRLADDFKTSVRRFVRQPAVTAVLVGVGALTIVVVLRGIRRR